MGKDQGFDGICSEVAAKVFKQLLRVSSAPASINAIPSGSFNAYTWQSKGPEIPNWRLPISARARVNCTDLQSNSE